MAAASRLLSTATAAGAPAARPSEREGGAGWRRGWRVNQGSARDHSGWRRSEGPRQRSGRPTAPRTRAREHQLAVAINGEGVPVVASRPVCREGWGHARGVKWDGASSRSTSTLVRATGGRAGASTPPTHAPRLQRAPLSLAYTSDAVQRREIAMARAGLKGAAGRPRTRGAALAATTQTALQDRSGQAQGDVSVLPSL